jgi:folate-binding protein YgfZ
MAGAARRDQDGSIWVCVGVVPERWIVVSPAAAQSPAAESHGVAREEWRALDIADGIPQVYAATSEAFVAQMLNLDVVGGIAFDKGCYTGQEVIARAHYRGKVKRRMQRFQTTGPSNLKPGDSGTLRDGRSFKVVDAAVLHDGRTEFLAVTTLSAAGDEDAPGGASSAGIAVLDAVPLALPYSLPT